MWSKLIVLTLVSHGVFLQGSPGTQGMVGPQGDPGDEVILNWTRNNGNCYIAGVFPATARLFIG